MFNIFNSKKIGFVISQEGNYNYVMPSTRLRCYDVMHELKKNGFKPEIYNSNNEYDLVFFQKCFNENHLKILKQLKKNGTYTVFDINIDVMSQKQSSVLLNNNQKRHLEKQKFDVHEFIQNVDCVLVSSFHLLRVYSKLHFNVQCIEEMVTDKFFKYKKKHKKNRVIKLMYVGTSSKSLEIKMISDVLMKLSSVHQIEMLFICEKKPNLNFIQSSFIKYNHKNIFNDMLKGDIKIAPRDLSYDYNLGHSLTKVAYPMALGIPAIASPVPSYVNREVLLCNNNEQWYQTLDRMIIDHELRNYVGMRSKNFIRNNFSQEIIGLQYKLFLDKLLH